MNFRGTDWNIVRRTSIAHVGRLLAEAEDYARSLPQAVRPILGVLIEALRSLDEKIAVRDVEISRRAQTRGPLFVRLRSLNLCSAT
jgi:hypothetical protein